jgi:DNA-binding SARP family transcriptional activator
MQEAFYRAMPEERRVHWHRRWAETLQARNRRGQGSNWWQVGSQFSLLGDAVETYAEWSQQPDPWRFPPPSWQAQEHCQRLAEHYFGLSEEQQAQHLYLALRARLLWVFHRWQSGDVGRLLHRPLSFGHYPDRSASENERLYARDLARQAVAHLWLGDYQEVGRCLEGVVRHLFVVSHDSGVVENGTTVPDYKRPDPMVDSENLRDLHLLLKLLRAEWLEAQGRYGELVDWHVTALDEVDRRAFKADDAGRWAWEALGRRADCYRGRQREMPGPSHNPCYVLVWDAGLSDVLLREWRAAARFYAGALDQAESAARETIRWWLVRRDLATYCDVDRPPHACPAFGHAVLARVLRWRDPAASQQQWQDALYWAEEYEYLGHLGPRYRLGLAQTLWVLGEREEADVLLEEVGQTARHQRNVFLEECSLRDRAGLALERQAWDQAAELCAEAGSLQGQTGVLYNRVREQVYRSVLARAGGDLAAAEAHIEAALAEGERLFHLLQRGFLHAEAARVYHALGRGDLSEQHAAMAREVFGRYAAQPLIEALDADLRRSAAALAPQRTADEKVEADLTPGPSPDRPGEGREAALAFRLLGRFELRRSGQTLTPADWGSRKARTLCKYLLLHADQPVPREVLMELCWPDQRVSQAERNLNTALHTLRQVLEPDRPHGAASRYLRSESGTVVFHLNPDVWVDVQAFERLARRARQHARAGEPDAGAAAWEAALALYGGDLLPEEVYEDWCAAARERLRETYMQGLVELARYRYEQGDDETALQWCQEALAHSPCLEAAARQLMLCLARLGRPNEALTTFQRLAKAMQRELGAEPEPATLALALRLCEGGTV